MTGPAQAALLLIGHGSTKDSAGARGAVQAHAKRIAGEGAFTEVATAFLKGGTAPAEALEGLASERICVVPHFMSAGYFVRRHIPSLLGLDGPVTRRSGRTLHYLAPPALSPAFADIVERRLLEAAGRLGLPAGELPVVLAAHGSPNDTASGDAAREQAGRLASREVFRRVEIAFIDEAPYFANVATRHTGPMIVGGLFAADGHHAETDIRTAVAQRPSAAYTGALGADPAVAGLIVAACRRRINV